MSDWQVLGLDGDPTPGDPDQTAGLAGRLLHQAELAERNRQRLAGVAAGSGDLGMEGGYAPKFRAVLAELPGELGKLGTAYRGAGEALRAFASDLRTEKSRAAAALRQGTAAAARYEGALREIRALLPDGRDLQVSRLLGVEVSVEQATEGLDEAIRAQARAAAGRARAAEQDKAAACRLADQAARLRGEAESRAVEGLNRALDHSGIRNKSFWEKAWDVVSWPFQSWDNFVSFCRGVAVVVGIVALFISGPIGWALVGVALAAGAVAFGDTLAKYAQGKASLLDVGLDALGLIPGSAGVIKLTGMATRLIGAGTRLAIIAKNLPSMGKLAMGSLRNARTALPFALERIGGIRAALHDPRAFARPAWCRFVGRDPIDLATGEMIMQQAPDIELAGALPFTLQRTYRSNYRVGRWFGAGWSSTLEHRLEVDDIGVCYAADDGLLFAYPFPAVGESVLPQEGPRLSLTRHAEGFRITDPASGRTFHFLIGTDIHGTRPAAVLPLAAMTDHNGHRIDLDYDADGSLTAIRHSGGYHLDVDTQRGFITEIRLRMPPGETDVVLMRYQYDESGNLTDVINSSRLGLRFNYDDHGRMAGWEDRNGTWYRYTYDDQDRCVATSGIGGHFHGTISYDKSECRTVETNSLGHATTYHFNDLLQIERVIDPLGGVTLYEWDRYDRKLSETDPLGRSTRYLYDRAGNLTRVTRPDGSQLTTEYNDLGLPVITVDPNGVVWRREYDGRGNLTTLIDPLGTRTTCDYDDAGHLAAVTDALGQILRFQTNKAGLPVAVTDPLGAITRYDLDAFGRVAAITDPVGGVTRLGWTIEGKLAWRSLPDGATERWAYDGEGNLVEYVDALGQTTRTEIGCFDVPTAQTAPDGAQLEFGYDTELQLVAVTNPQGLVWRYKYDAAGTLVKEIDFNGRVLSYLCDAAGQLIERTNGAGETIRFIHDPLGNVIEQRSDDAVTRFDYDPVGRITRATNADADLVVERDLLGRVVTESCNGRTISFEYDVLGRRVRRHTPSGAESTWEYDSNDRPVTLQTAGHRLRFGYDAAGREVERLLGTETLLAQTWDSNHRVRSQTLTTTALDATRTSAPKARLVQRRSYSYRPDSYLIAVDDHLSGARHFDLDVVGQVTAVQGREWAERYAYDLAGNVTQAEWMELVKDSLEVDARGDREYVGTLIRRAGKVRYEHDPQGRVILRQQKRLSDKPRTWHYNWDADDQLTGITTPEGERWRYRYDALGRRIAKEHVAVDGASIVERVDFIWDGTVLAEQTRTGGRSGEDGTTVWEWDPATFRPITQTERIARHGTPQQRIDEEFYAIVTDLVGTPAELLDSEGNVAWHSRAALWGTLVAQERSAASTPLRFPGQYYDPESDLNYNYFRYYEPAAQRYDSSDPAGLAGGVNPHAYVLNPTVWIDPLGLMGCEDAAKDIASKAWQTVEHSRLSKRYGAGGVRELPDGRFRYYGKLRSAQKPGEMTGARLVREWNPASGRRRTWYETLDHAGRVRQVHPKQPSSPYHYRFDEYGNYAGRWE